LLTAGRPLLGVGARVGAIVVGAMVGARVMGATAVGAAEDVGRPSAGGSKVSDSSSGG
jgi:hypothetical protein